VRTEQRPGIARGFGTKGPVAAPEFILPDGKRPGQRRFEIVGFNLGEQAIVRAAEESNRRKPIARRGQAAEPDDSPDGFPRSARRFLEPGLTRPPAATNDPKLPRMFIRFGPGDGDFSREQVGEAKEAGFGFGWECLPLPSKRRELGDTAHGPAIVLVTQSGQQFLPKGLLPSALAGAGFDLSSLAAENESKQPD